MILTKNEAWLLAFGYSITNKDIRLDLREEERILKDGTVKTVYLIVDIEEAKNLYKRYMKTFNRIFKHFNKEFLNSCFIAKEVNK